MPSAARVGDKTSHGDSLGPGPGSSNVNIGGKPAWRAGIDQHTCSQSDGQKPHVGGVVIGGSPKVFINRLPAARQGDKIIETGTPNSNIIKEGCSKVQIGG